MSLAPGECCLRGIPRLWGSLSSPARFTTADWNAVPSGPAHLGDARISTCVASHSGGDLPRGMSECERRLKLFRKPLVFLNSMVMMCEEFYVNVQAAGTAESSVSCCTEGVSSTFIFSKGGMRLNSSLMFLKHLCVCSQSLCGSMNGEHEQALKHIF
ncbi:hypothetical protein NDU88_005405 [Pleurodeles waltl]|uniref:Uncharacterized protein n=1 Tax=Pleurodeles waltl TaxID=8319 RepID=A0AAV7MB43_PLEWA|nr:hypothetical protein NDU88_005405 [Pleurodeles waltl]